VDAAASITDAQFQNRASLRIRQLAEAQGHIDSLEEIGQLKHAIDTNDIDRVKR